MQVIEILLDAVQRLSLADDMEAITGIVKTAARKVSGSDGASFILRENNLCYYADEDAISPLWKGKRFALDSCISGWVMQNRKPAVIADIYQDKRIPVDFYRPTFVKSMVMIPIRSADPIGAIGVYWARNYRASPKVVKLLQSLADSTAVAMEKIQIFSKYKETIRELKRQQKANVVNSEKNVSFNYIFEKSLNEIYVFDAQTLHFVFANKGALKNIGFTRKELFKLTPVDLKPEFDRLLFLEKLKPLFEDKIASLVFETLHRRKNGTTYPVEIHLQKSTFNNKAVFVAIIIDISERKENEEKLRRSESELKRAQQITHIGSWFLDMETNQVTWSAELYKMYGFDPTLPPPPYTEHMKLYTPESWEMLSTSLAKTAETGIPYELELRTVRDDRTNGWMWVRGESIHDTAGKTIALWGAAQDITERKQNEEKLKESQKMLELFFAQSLDGFFFMMLDKPVEWNDSVNKKKVLDYAFEHQHITRVNSAMLAQYGATEEQFLGLTPNDLYTHDIKHGRQVWNDLFNAGQLHIDTHENKLDGTDMIIEGDYLCLYDSENRITGHFGVQKDVTDIRNAEELLRESKEKYRVLFANNPQPMWIYDTETLAFLEVNEAAINHYGYSEVEFLSMTLKDIRPAEDIPALLKDIEKTSEHLSSKGEWRHVKKNGDVISVEITSHTVISNNRDARHVLINDITERKRTQLEYQTMIKTTRDGFWIVDAETGRILESNQSYCDMIGYSGEELLQMTVQDLEALETYEETRHHIELIKEYGYDSFESKHKTKSGKLIDIEASVTFVSINGGKFFVLVKDISERKQIEKELLKLSHAVEQNPSVIAVTDVNGKLEYINPQFTRLTGYTREEAFLQNPNILRSGSQSSEFYHELWETIKAGKVWTGEFHNRKKDGTLYWESATISPVFDQKGKIVQFMKLAIDVTEQKRFDDTRKLLLEISQLATEHLTLNSLLAEVHEKLKQIIRADNFYVALHNDKDDTFIFPYHIDEYDKNEINKPYHLINGFTDYALKSNQSLIITPEYKFEIDKTGIVKGIGDRSSVWLGVPFKTKKGNWPNAVIAIQDYQNLETYTEVDKSIMEIIAHSVGSFIERIKYQEDLIHAKEKAEESDRLKSAFLANMSHEIRTPMNGILGFTELLLEPDLTSEQKESYISIVNQSGQRMLNTVNAIVEISKIEAGIVTMDLKEVNVQEHLDELIRFFTPEAEKKGLKLLLENEELKIPAIIVTDRNKLDSILTNLIKNAIKYTRAGEIRVGCKVKVNLLEFWVKDTGIGIPADRQHAVFERFIQADLTTSRSIEGSGLGLAITKAYVEMLGGEIRMESKTGEGSSFFFSLPLNLV